MSQQNTKLTQDEELGYKSFKRPPRIMPQLAIGEYEIPAPNDLSDVSELESSWERLLPTLMTIIPTLLYVLIMFVNPGSGRSNMSILVVRLFSSVFVLGLSFAVSHFFLKNSTKRREMRQQEKVAKEKENYEQRIEKLKHKIFLSNAEQRSVALRLHPDPKNWSERLPDGGQVSDKRLWERRPGDEDFLELRMGIGVLPSASKIIYPDRLDYTLSGQQQDQLEEAIRIGEQAEYLREVPITVPLGRKTSLAIVGPTDSSTEGGKSEAHYGLVRAMLLQLVMHHAPNDVALCILSPKAPKDFWSWADQLPHCIADLGPEKIEADLVGKNTRECEKILDFLTGIFKRRHAGSEGEGGTGLVRHFVILIDDPEHKLQSHPLIPSLLNYGNIVQMSLVFSQATISDVPSESQAILRLDLKDIPLLYVEAGPDGQRIPPVSWDIEDIRPRSKNPFELAADKIQAVLKGDPQWHRFKNDSIKPDNLSLAEAKAAFRTLYTFRLDSLDISTNIPQQVSFWDMYEGNLKTLDDLAVLKRWYSPQGIRQHATKSLSLEEVAEKGKYPLPVPIGLLQSKPEKKAAYFSLAQGFDGPHSLIGGTTGSGKSEFLQTLICALAVDHHPHFLSLFLIDYKGGSSFLAFKDLPHCAGVVSDLDKSEAQRALIAMQTEIVHRKQVFAKAEVKEIVDYHAKYFEYLQDIHKNPTAPNFVEMEPIPHLIIIIDEFAELKVEMPDFMPEMSRIARVGRSLGIHLILATQRPQGAVSEEIRANAQSAICLRVKSSADSRDLIGDSSAMHLPSDIPGRGYLKSGNDLPILFQSAYVGGTYDPKGQVSEDWSRGFTLYFNLNTEAKIDDENSFEFEYKPSTYLQDNQPNLATEEKESLVKALIKHLKAEAEKDRQGHPAIQPISPLWMDLLTPELKFSRLLEEAILREKNEKIRDYLVKFKSKKQADDLWGIEYWRVPPGETRTYHLWLGQQDDPYKRKQPFTRIDLRDPKKRSHVLIYGAPGSGRSSFLQLALLNLAFFHTPWEVHFHLIDFGLNNGLAIMKDYPHVGNYLSPNDEDKLRIFMDWLEQEFSRRRGETGDFYPRAEQALTHSRVNWGKSLSQKERLSASELPPIKPLLVICIDNVTEFLNVFGNDPQEQEALLQRLSQDGLSVGILLLLSGGNVFSEIRPRITRSILMRAAFRLPTDEQMLDVVGSKTNLSPDSPLGRLMWRADNSLALQMQAAYVSPEEHERFSRSMKAALADVKQYIELPQEMLPASIPDFEDKLTWDMDFVQTNLRKLAAEIQAERSENTNTSNKSYRSFNFLLGQDFKTLELYEADLQRDGNFCIFGPRNSGKTSILASSICTAAYLYSPKELQIFLITAPNSSSEVLTTLSRLPHVAHKQVFILSPNNLPETTKLLQELKAIGQQISEAGFTKRYLIVIDEAQAILPADRDPSDFAKILADLPGLKSGTNSLWQSGFHYAISYRFTSRSSAASASQPSLLKEARAQTLDCFSSTSDKTLVDSWRLQASQIMKNTGLNLKNFGRGLFHSPSSSSDPSIIQYLSLGDSTELNHIVDEIGNRWPDHE